MKIFSNLLAALLLVAHHHQQTTNALILKSDGTKRPSSTTNAVNTITEVNDINRRTSFTRVATTIAAGVAAGGSLFGSSIPVAMAATSNGSIKGAEAFVGTYTDPINHPGGKRTIKLLDGQKVGNYQLAEVLGMYFNCISDSNPNSLFFYCFDSYLLLILVYTQNKNYFPFFLKVVEEEVNQKVMSSQLLLSEIVPSLLISHRRVDQEILLEFWTKVILNF
jgi:hypothetical protein